MTNEHKPPYGVQYRHNNETWTFVLPYADSWEDAEARLKSIGAYGKVYGSNLQRLPANSVTLPFVGLWASITCWWRNRRHD